MRKLPSWHTPREEKYSAPIVASVLRLIAQKNASETMVPFTVDGPMLVVRDPGCRPTRSTGWVATGKEKLGTPFTLKVLLKTFACPPISTTTRSALNVHLGFGSLQEVTVPWWTIKRVVLTFSTHFPVKANGLDVVRRICLP